MRHEQSSGHLTALVCVIIWGSTFVVSKSLMAHLRPVQLMLLRFILGYAALWVIHPKWHFRWREEGRFVLMALFANTLYAWAENTALTITQASNVSILVSTTPIITAAALAAFGGERLNRRQTLGFAIAFAGVVLVVFNGAVTLKLRPAGDLLALAASVSWAVYGFLLRRWSSEYASALITRKLMFYGMLTVLPLVIAEGRPINFPAILTWAEGWKLLYLGLVGSAFSYLLWNNTIKKIGVLTANLYIYMVPLITLVVSAVFLHEKITPMGLIGILMVIAGMVLGTLQAKGQAQP
ncbi:MAG: DMT family transporter [Christensenellales bacterium]